MIMTTTTSTFLNFSLNEVLTIIGIVVFMWALLRANKFIFHQLTKKTTTRNRYKILFLEPILRLIIIFAAILWILIIITNLNDIDFVTIIGALSIVIGFAFREYVSSIIAGIVILYENPYRIGDWIEIDGIYGEVESINLRAVKIRTPDDTEVYIPQMKIWDTPILNSNAGTAQLMCVTKFYLVAGQDPRIVKEVLHRVALISPYTHLEMPINVIITDYPYYTQYSLKSYPIDPKNQFIYSSDLTMRAKVALRDKKIQFLTLPLNIVHDSLH